ncbi:DUF389 domain-containing protein [Kytococcus sedentarius]|uniref:DUF389 domain-containing protein n=1 Tax=Kytococcus sedentarius TaxID=1276 RepID=UPI0035BBCB5B
MQHTRDSRVEPQWNAGAALAVVELAALGVALGLLASVPDHWGPMVHRIGAGVGAVWAVWLAVRASRRDASPLWMGGLGLAAAGLAVTALGEGAWWGWSVRAYAVGLVLLIAAEVRWRQHEENITGPGLNELLFASLATVTMLSPTLGLRLSLFAGLALVVLHVGIDAAHRAGFTDVSAGDADDGRLARWLRSNAASGVDREEVVETLFFEAEQGRGRTVQFLVQMALSTVIATLGVLTDSTAVVIGAMVVAPLMLPLLATGLSLGMGWPRRMVRSLALAGLGIALAVGVSFVLVRALGPGLVLAENSQVSSRIAPTVPDLLIAVASGAAGAFALSRRNLGTALPGVAIAIALVPPLAVVATCLEQGAWSAAAGAGLLFLVNIVCMVAAAALTFVLTGVVPLSSLETNQERVGAWGVGVGVAAGLVLCALVLHAGR